MKIAHIYPDTFMALWTKHSKNEFVDQNCTPDCDFIYCGSITQIDRAYDLGVKFNKPIVCWVWDIPVNWRMWGDFEGNLHRDPENYDRLNMLMDCKSVVSASKYTQGVLNMFGIKSEQMYFYVDIDAMKEVPIAPKVNRVIQVSRYTISKRFELTIDMWEKLQEKYPDWELMFIGLGKEYAERLKAYGKKLKNFTVLVDQPRYTTLRMIQQSKVLVAPSVFEGWGITPLEGAYYHCNLALSGIPTNSEMWPDVDYFKDNADDYARVVERELEYTVGWGFTPEDCGYTPKMFADRMDKHLNKVFKS